MYMYSCLFVIAGSYLSTFYILLMVINIYYVIFSFLVFANSWASMCKTLFKATWTECWIVFHRNDRQAEEFTTLLKEKDDQIAQLLEEGNDWY